MTPVPGRSGAPSYCHLGGVEPLLGATLPAHLRSVAAAQAGAPAVISRHQGRRLSYGELMAAADRLARGLLGLGFGRGDRVGVWSTNNVEWLLLQLATARIGAVLVNINPAYRPRELAYALERARVQGLFLIPAFRHSDYVSMLTGEVPELVTAPGGHWRSARFPALRRVVLFDPRGPDPARPAAGFNLWNEVLEAGRGVDAAELEAATAALDRDDPINIQFTSGTTGFPKAVLLSHHNLLNNAWFSARLLGFTPADRLCVPVPFYHCFGMVLANLLCLSAGAALVLPAEHFDAGACLDAIAAERCTAVHGVPTMFIALLEAQADRPRAVESLRTGIMAGAPCPAPLLKRVMGALHCPEILIGYGQTEASPLTHLTRRDDDLGLRTETVGRNLPHQEVKVVDVKSGATLPRGESGEVCFRGYHVMKGYYGDEAATRRTVDANGWLHSGDLGSMDADGSLRITGRLKELIIRGGENIYPREIEEVLFAHPAVAQAAVFGVRDDYWGEEVAAWVQLKPGRPEAVEALREWCAAHLAHYKVPRHLRIVTEFPMTVTGKLQKFRMREAMEKTLGEGGNR